MLYNRHLYSNKEKVYILWSPKSGSSSIIQMFFELIKYDYDKEIFIHKNMKDYMRLQATTPLLSLDNYVSLQVVRNTYERAASSYMCSLIRNEEWYKKREYIPISNTLSFIDFLKCVDDIKNSNKKLDPHYDIQYMPNTEHILNHGYVVNIKNLSNDINIINNKMNLSLNSEIKYDRHSAKKVNPFMISYEELYKDSETKNLVKNIYKQDIEAFGFECPF